MTSIKNTEINGCTGFNTQNPHTVLLVSKGLTKTGIKAGVKSRTQNGCKQCCPATGMSEEEFYTLTK